MQKRFEGPANDIVAVRAERWQAAKDEYGESSREASAESSQGMGSEFVLNTFVRADMDMIQIIPLSEKF